MTHLAIQNRCACERFSLLIDNLSLHSSFRHCNRSILCYRYRLAVNGPSHILSSKNLLQDLLNLSILRIDGNLLLEIHVISTDDDRVTFVLVQYCDCILNSHIFQFEIDILS